MATGAPCPRPVLKIFYFLFFFCQTSHYSSLHLNVVDILLGCRLQGSVDSDTLSDLVSVLPPFNIGIDASPPSVSAGLSLPIAHIHRWRFSWSTDVKLPSEVSQVLLLLTDDCQNAGFLGAEQDNIRTKLNEEQRPNVVGAGQALASGGPGAVCRIFVLLRVISIRSQSPRGFKRSHVGRLWFLF